MVLAASTAVLVFGCIAAITAIGIPLLKRKIGMSYRWTLVVYAATALLLVITDAEGLADDVRTTAIVGCVVLCSIFMVFHSIERLLEKGATPRFTLKKGDAKADVIITSRADRDDRKDDGKDDEED